MFEIDRNGWCMQARHVPSPNCEARPEGVAPELLVIHNISLPPGNFGGSYIEDLFTNRLDCGAHPSFADLKDLRVSAHFLIRRDGEPVQFVSVVDKAWHAGISAFEGRERCNDFSVGIEIEGSDDEAFSDAQYQTLTALTYALCRHYPLRNIAGHQDIAPGRKTDPGPFFDWLRYRNSLYSALPPYAGLPAENLLPMFPFLNTKTV